MVLMKPKARELRFQAKPRPVLRTWSNWSWLMILLKHWHPVIGAERSLTAANVILGLWGRPVLVGRIYRKLSMIVLNCSWRAHFLSLS